MLRGGAETVSFLDEVYAQEDLIEHRWWENAAICRLLGYELDPVGPGGPTALLTEHTKLISGRWNSIPDAPAAKPRIRHYPGYSLKVRAAFMTRDLLRSAITARLRSQGERSKPCVPLHAEVHDPRDESSERSSTTQAP